MRKRILSALSALMLMLSVLSVTAFAAEAPDLDRKGSISITMTYRGQTVPGGSLTLYRVADVHVENGAEYSFRYTREYANCQVSLDRLNDSGTAQAIALYTKLNNISGTKAWIDEKGKVTFPNLELGLYLLIQQDAAEGYEAVSPFLVSVPGIQGEHYIYDVDGSPKLSLERAPEPTSPPNPDDLPQTGLNQWPIPVLAVIGLLFFVMGLALYTSGKKKSHEG